MTIKELKEKINDLPDDMVVEISCCYCTDQFEAADIDVFPDENEVVIY